MKLCLEITHPAIPSSQHMEQWPNLTEEHPFVGIVDMKICHCVTMGSRDADPLLCSSGMKLCLLSLQQVSFQGSLPCQTLPAVPHDELEYLTEAK